MPNDVTRASGETLPKVHRVEVAECVSALERPLEGMRRQAIMLNHIETGDDAIAYCLAEVAESITRYFDEAEDLRCRLIDIAKARPA